MRNYHDILVFCPHYDRHGPALALAAKLAAQHAIRLTALHVRWPVPDLEAAVLPSVAERVLAQAGQELQSAQGAEPALRSFIDGYGKIDVEWRVVEGHPEHELVYFAACHDLMMMPVGQAADSLTPVFVGQVVLEAHTPCLIVPDSWTVPEQVFSSVAIGWDGSMEVLRAVRGALPLLGRADRVVVLAGDGKRYRSLGHERATFDLSPWLEARGIVVEHQPFKPEAGLEGEGLLNACGKHGCDLLVMGAYGHNRFREWLLGGATRDVLHTLRMPVLMAH